METSKEKAVRLRGEALKLYDKQKQGLKLFSNVSDEELSMWNRQLKELPVIQRFKKDIENEVTKIALSMVKDTIFIKEPAKLANRQGFCDGIIYINSFEKRVADELERRVAAKQEPKDGSDNRKPVGIGARPGL